MGNEVLAALVGVVGTLAGAWYGARLSRRAARDLLASQAKAEFAAAFTDTLFKLTGPAEEQGIGQAIHILQEDYPRHLVAYLRLRSILPKDHQEVVDRAWREYAGGDANEPAEECNFYRFIHVLAPESDEHQFMLAAKHVHGLLAKIGT